MDALAPYGKPRYVDIIKEKVDKNADDVVFSSMMSYLIFATGLTMTSKKFDKLFGGPARKSETELTQREMDIAASIQKVTEEVVIKIARSIAKETGEHNLCLKLAELLWTSCERKIYL